MTHIILQALLDAQFLLQTNKSFIGLEILKRYKKLDSIAAKLRTPKGQHLWQLSSPSDGCSKQSAL